MYTDISFESEYLFPTELSHQFENSANALPWYFFEKKKVDHPGLQSTLAKNRLVNKAARQFFKQKLDEHGGQTGPRYIAEAIGFFILKKLIDNIKNNEIYTF